MNSTYVCPNCGKEFEAHSARRSRRRKLCDACKRERQRENSRAYYRKKSLNRMGWRSRWAQWTAEQRRAESAFRRCGVAKDPATFVWPAVRDGRAAVVEIRGQMSFAPGQILGRQK